MSDNPTFTAVGDEPLEARIVAWVLGDAAAFEATELERLCAERPELVVFRRRMRALHGLLTEAEAAQPDLAWKLPPEKRKALDEIFGAPLRLQPTSGKAKVSKARRRSRWMLYALAACLMFFFIIAIGFSTGGIGSPGKVAMMKAKASRMVDFSPQSGGGDRVALRTEYPSELIEGTPKPIRLPGVAGADPGATNRAYSADSNGGVALERNSRSDVALDGSNSFTEGRLTRSAPAPAAKPAAPSLPLDKPIAANTRGNLAMGESDEPQSLAGPATAPLPSATAPLPSATAASDSAQSQLSDLGSLAGEKPAPEHRPENREITRGVGLRSGDGAIARNNIDAMLQPPQPTGESDGYIVAGDVEDARSKTKSGSGTLSLAGKVTAGTLHLDRSTATPSPAEPGAPPPPPAPGQQPASGGIPTLGKLPMLGQLAKDAVREEPEKNVTGTATALFDSKPGGGPAQAPQGATIAGGIAKSDSDFDMVDALKRQAPAGGGNPGNGAELAYSYGFQREAADKEGKGSSITGLNSKPGANYYNDVTDPAPADEYTATGRDIRLRERRIEDIPTPTIQPRPDSSLAWHSQDEATKGRWDRSGGTAAGGQLLEGRDADQPDDFKKAEERFKTANGKLENSLMLADGEKVIAEQAATTGAAPDRQTFREGEKDSDADSRELLESTRTAGSNKELVDKKLAEPAAAPITLQPLAVEHAQNIDTVRKGLYVAEGNFNLGKYDQAKAEYEKVLGTDPYNTAARRGLEQIASAKSTYYRAAYDQSKAELLTEVDKTWEMNLPADAPALEEAIKKQKEAVAQSQKLVDNDAKAKGIKSVSRKPATALGLEALEEKQLDSGGRQSFDDAWKELGSGLAKLEALEAKLAAVQAPPKPAPVDPGKEIAAAEDPYSTFSLSISDASFKTAHAALAKGEQPDPAGIRIEQFYNAMDYGDPAPSSGEPVAAKIEQAAHPVVPGRNLVRVALRTAATGRSAAQPLQLTLLIDQSGSMARDDRKRAMDRALKELATLLTANDRITVVGFSLAPRLLADSLPGDQAGKLSSMINLDANEGGTNLERALLLGSQLATSHKKAGAQNRLVLFTDGAANLGNADPERLAQTVKEMRQNGLAFDVAGLGTSELNDRLLAELARHGNGRFYVVDAATDEPNSFAKQLAGAFRPAAENVKVQVRFNPQRVKGYKLIGFEEHRLKQEDFRNDAVDAAELAAEEAGVALYQVQPLPSGSGDLGEVSVRFRDTATGQMVERSWSIPFDPSAPGFDQANPSLQLAGLAMLSAEKLRGGPMAAAIDFARFTTPRATIRQTYPQARRVAELLEMIERLR